MANTVLSRVLPPLEVPPQILTPFPPSLPIVPTAIILLPVESIAWAYLPAFEQAQLAGNIALMTPQALQGTLLRAYVQLSEPAGLTLNLLLPLAPPVRKQVLSRPPLPGLPPQILTPLVLLMNRGIIIRIIVLGQSFPSTLMTASNLGFWLPLMRAIKRTLPQQLVQTVMRVTSLALTRPKAISELTGTLLSGPKPLLPVSRAKSTSCVAFVPI